METANRVGVDLHALNPRTRGDSFRERDDEFWKERERELKLIICYQHTYHTHIYVDVS